MCVNKDRKTNTWTANVRFKDSNGISKRTTKRGFKTRDEAEAWEHELKVSSGTRSLSLSEFFLVYARDIKPTVKLSTWDRKASLYEKWIDPYLGTKKVEELSTPDILLWQKLMRSQKKTDGTPFSQTYLRSINNQLEAILNHAVNHYGLYQSPMRGLRKMGKKQAGEMKFWTKAQYLTFAEQIEDNPDIHCAFEILYWCGLRVGELLALTEADIDFNRGVIIVRRGLSKEGNRYVLSEPKTSTSRRVVQMPAFLEEEISALLYLRGIQPHERIFPFTPHKMRQHMKRGTAKTALPQIRVHDLRHSHVSLLIELGFHAPAIAARVGHSSVWVTYTYAHLFPSKQQEISDALEEEGGLR